MTLRGKKADEDNIYKILEEESKYANPIDPEKTIFALDIGTRSVVGIVGIDENGIFNIIDSEMMEHRSRAMMDGQIHDIDKVAEVVKIIKEKLESRLGFNLTSVSIAAAGRSLKTSSVTFDKNLDSRATITQDIINSLELESVQLAYTKIQEECKADATNYYCIGHTVVNYHLNGYVISNLLGHKGKQIGATVLATFLPHTVVDSLYTVMAKVGLNVSSLTLEPIAAINVSIPSDIRLLNIGLIDIGAGTSDIAITKDGSIIAYAMCAVAGDEVTESISKHYLLDFNTAESVKVQLQSIDEVEFTDIMGITSKVKSSEVIKVIEPTVNHLADIISDKITECNGKSPNAVFCIGGGSQTPGLTKMLAQKLGIQAERVGVRGTDIIRNIKFYDKKLKGPEAVTPIGIAVTGLTKKGNNFIQIQINKRTIELYNTGKISVGDAIAASGFAPEQLIPRRGKHITFTINGKNHTVKGEFGHPSEIYVNSELTSLDKKIMNGDQIRVIPSEAGEDAKAFVEDFINNKETKKINFNGNDLDITPRVKINGKITSLKQSIKEGDQVVIEEINTLADLAKACEIDMSKFNIYVNSQKLNFDYKLKGGDVVETIYCNTVDKNNEIIKCESDNNNIDVKSNNKENANDVLNITERKILVSINDKFVELKGKSQYIFADIFNYFDVDLNKNSGRIDLRLNGLPAGYTDNLKEGDIIDISWR